MTGEMNHLPTLPELACAMRGLHAIPDVPHTSGRGIVDWIAGRGFRAVALDAVHPDLRPRSLDRSARRDLAASLRRRGLMLAGVDVMVPASHFAGAEHVDRALSAAQNAIGFAQELGSLLGATEPVVCLALPDEPTEGVIESLRAASEDAGVVLAVHRRGLGGLARSLDLDALLDAGVDPAGEMSRECAQIRWGGPRPDRRVDLMAIVSAFAMLGGSSCVLDLSHGRSPGEVAENALSRWSELGWPGL